MGEPRYKNLDLNYYNILNSYSNISPRLNLIDCNFLTRASGEIGIHARFRT